MTTMEQTFKPAPKATVRVDTNPESPWEGCVSVEAGYYGLVDETRIGWTVEFAKTKANANRIVRNQAFIDAAVAKHGGRARLSIEFTPDGWIAVHEYDWNKWVEMAEAKR